MRLRYDPAEDRIAMLVPRSGDARAYWLTRRQCMALLRACEEPGTEGADAHAQVARTAPKPPPAALPADLQPKLARVGLRRSAKALMLRLQAADEAQALQLTLGPSDQSRLRDSLLQIARRAQWALGEPPREQPQAPAPHRLH